MLAPITFFDTPFEQAAKTASFRGKDSPSFFPRLTNLSLLASRTALGLALSSFWGVATIRR